MTSGNSAAVHRSASENAASSRSSSRLPRAHGRARPRRPPSIARSRALRKASGAPGSTCTLSMLKALGPSLGKEACSTRAFSARSLSKAFATSFSVLSSSWGGPMPPDAKTRSYASDARRTAAEMASCRPCTTSTSRTAMPRLRRCSHSRLELALWALSLRSSSPIRMTPAVRGAGPRLGQRAMVPCGFGEASPASLRASTLPLEPVVPLAFTPRPLRSSQASCSS
mmetsp:Transcript_7562/g.19388  ORF Transcript_7562/g.19388 Transcript_7562/m.19388 type:complete len:226 (-) Transcript_7562:692-1369(-)